MQLNALDKSIFRSTHWPVDCVLSTRLCMPIATASVALRNPTPTCSGCSLATCYFATDVLSRAFPATRLNVSPTATGRTPSSGLRSGVKFAPQSQGLWLPGNVHFAHISVNRARALISVPPWPGRLRASCKCDGRRPDGPGALARGK